jgi:hypothetical protein
MMSDINKLTSNYLARIQGLVIPQEFEFTIDQLRNPELVWFDWERSPGVYCFLQKDIVQYVGRATLSVGLGSRIHNQIYAFGDPKWDLIIKDRETRCKLFVFAKEVGWLH